MFWFSHMFFQIKDACIGIFEQCITMVKLLLDIQSLSPDLERERERKRIFNLVI